MKPNFSEFSYGFALVNELIAWPNQPVTAVPIYPSLIEEGHLGYDVLLERGGVPLFIQFKLSHCMVRASAEEVRHGVLFPPFYRMHLFPRTESRQHGLLLDLENQGNAVFYGAPEFHQQHEFNAAYLTRRVEQRSWFFRPVDIGPLLDDGPHHVAFRAGEDHGWFCSTPTPLKCFKGLQLATHLAEKVRVEGKRAVSEKALLRLSDWMLNELRVQSLIGARNLAALRQKPNTLERISSIAQAFYGAQMFIVNERESTA